MQDLLLQTVGGWRRIERRIKTRGGKVWFVGLRNVVGSMVKRFGRFLLRCDKLVTLRAGEVGVSGGVRGDDESQ